MAIKSKLRINQMHEAIGALDSNDEQNAPYVPASLSANDVAAASALDATDAPEVFGTLEETFIRMARENLRRFGSSATPALGGGTAGVLAHFSADDEVSELLIQNSFANNAAKVKILSSAQNNTDAISITAPGTGAKIQVTAASTVEMEAATEVIVDSPKLSLEDDAVVLSMGAADDVTFTHDSNAGLDMAGAGQFSLDFDTSVNIDSANGAIKLGADDVDGAITIGEDGERAISIGTDAGTGGPSTSVSLEASAINIGTGGTAGAAITIGESSQANPIVLEAGTGSILMDADDVIQIESSGGAISIGNDAIAQQLNLGTGGARPILLGSAAAASLTMDGGVGAFALQADADSTIDSGAALDVTSTGVMALDATSDLELNSEAEIKIGHDARDQNISVGTAGAREISIGSSSAVLVQAQGSSALYEAAGQTVDPQNGNAAELFADASDLYNQSSALLLESSHVDGDLMLAGGRDMAILAASQQAAADTTGATLAAAVANLNAFGYTNDLGSDVEADSHTMMLGDVYCRGTYNSGAARFWSADGIPLSLATKEWYDFKVAFGEVSLLNALVQAGSGGTTDAGSYIIKIGSNGLSRDVYLLGSHTTPANARASDNGDYDIFMFHSAGTGAATNQLTTAIEAFPSSGLDANEITSALKVFVNGQLLVGRVHHASAPSADASYDYHIRDNSIDTAGTYGGSDFSLVFGFDLEEGDVVQVVLG